MKIQFKLALPILLGTVSTFLMVWDIHNQHVIESVGMGWDTGAPLWPYQTPDTLLYALNTPVYLLTAPVSNLFGLIGTARYFLLFPTGLLWWSVVGIVLDRKLLVPRSSMGLRWLILPMVIAVRFLIAGVYFAHDPAAWWLQYSRSFLGWDNLILLRLMAPAIWCFLLALSSALFAKRLITSACGARSGSSRDPWVR